MMNQNRFPIPLPYAPTGFPMQVAPPACGCEAAPASTSLLKEPLPRSLSAFAPTSSWSSNLFGANKTGTGQVIDPAQSGAPGGNVWSMLASGLGLAGTGLGAYHGYKRTGSIGWAIGWALLGGLFPIITIPVAVAQGFGRPEPAFRGARK